MNNNAKNRKRTALSAGIAVLALGSFANVGVFNGAGQTPVVDNTDAIQMVEEEVVMTPRAAKGPVTTSCANLDPMDYRCTFRLRNLRDEPVKLQVGFPLDAEYIAVEDGGRLAADFNFSARCGDETFDVRFVAKDGENRFSKVFLWDMAFAPRQERILTVSYTMEGYLGLNSTQVIRSSKKKELKAAIARMRTSNALLAELFTTGIGEAHCYVTGTGSCWAGDIEKATFKYYPQDFEAYLEKRGAYVETEEECKSRLEVFAKRGKRDVRELLKPDCPMSRCWYPAPDAWKRVDDGPDRYHYELTYAPFRPESRDAITLGFVAPPMPTKPRDVDVLESIVRQYVAKSDKDLDEKQFVRDAKDVVLEFYGVKTDNARIASFLEEQCWWGQKHPISEALKKRLTE